MEFALIIKKLKNQLSEQEEREFERWYSESENHRIFFKKISANFDGEELHVDQERAWYRLKSKIQKKEKVRHRWYYAYAAIFIIVLGSGLFYSTIQNSSLPIPASPSANAIVLTTEDGTEIDLSSGKSYRNKNVTGSGKELYYKPDSLAPPILRYNFLTIPRGEVFTLTLSDNTIIWLNSDTKIKYPVSFRNDEPRLVEVIYGEAFFEVSPSSENNGMNFFVKTRTQTIEVLGTEFNVKAYQEDLQITTTLAGGEIVLTNSLSQQEEKLIPGLQSIYDPENINWIIREVDVDNEISWKKGIFSFKNKELKEIMVTLSRWYNVEVEISTKNLETLKFNGVIRRTQDLEDLLNILQETGKLRYEIENNKITLKEKQEMKNEPE